MTDEEKKELEVSNALRDREFELRNAMDKADNEVRAATEKEYYELKAQGVEQPNASEIMEKYYNAHPDFRRLQAEWKEARKALNLYLRKKPRYEPEKITVEGIEYMKTLSNVDGKDEWESVIGGRVIETEAGVPPKPDKKHWRNPVYEKDYEW
jgi:hypothetical protein